MKIICFLFCLFISTLALAQPFDHGLLWEIKDKNQKKSYLLGTIHLADEAIDPIFSTVKSKIADSRLVMTEYKIKPTDTEAIYKNLIMTETPIQEKLTPSEYTDLTRYMSKYTVDERLYTNASSFQNYNLLVNAHNQNRLVLDFKISQYAQDHKIAHIGLEELTSVMESILKYDDSYFLPALKELLAEPDNIGKFLREIKELYLSQNLTNILSYVSTENPGITDEFIKHNVVRRNHVMANRAISEIEQGGVFIAVGAAHLGGQEGLLMLLSNAGFELTPMPLPKS